MGDTHRMSYNKPRLLGPQETLHALNHWKATTEVYYSRDSDFEPFFEEGVTWNPQHANGNFGFQNEGGDHGRTAAKQAKQLRQLLIMISSHIPSPHDHIQNKLLQESRSFADVWSIIYKSYGAVTTHEVFLDLMQMTNGSDYCR